MIESFNNLLKEESWRVRLSVYDLMGEIGKTFGGKAFSDTIEDLFLKYFTDKAAAVGETGFRKSGEIADHFGQDWVTEKLVPKIMETFNNTELSYLHGMTCIQTFENVLKNLSSSDLKQKFIPVL